MSLGTTSSSVTNTNRSNIADISFLIGSTVTLGLLHYTFSFLRSHCSPTESLNEKIFTVVNKKLRYNQIYNLTPQLRNEQLSNTLKFFGSYGMFSITNASILIVGLGGVGSHTAQMLARAGVHHLRLVDFDQVTLSSLNRNSSATLRDVGTPKVVAVKKYLEQICPCSNMLDIDARVKMYTGNEEYDGDLLIHPSLLIENNHIEKKNWNYIIDAIDDVPTKAKLLAHCIRNNIPIISCMSAGGKSDITRLHVSNLRGAICDPLARKVRLELRKVMNKDRVKNDCDHSFMDNIDQISVVYSSENTVVNLAKFTEEQQNKGLHNFGAVPHMRKRLLPVLGTMPAIMGQTIAGLTLCKLGNKPFLPMSGKRILRHTSHKIYQYLKNREKTISNYVVFYTGESNSARTGNNTHDILSDKNIWVGPLQIDLDDVEYTLDEVWGNRCSVTGESTQTVLQLVRWDLRKPSNCQNLVLLGSKALEKFDEYEKSTGDGRNSIPFGITNKIISKLESCMINSRF